MANQGGIRSTVEFPPPVGCPVAEVSTRIEAPIRSIRPSIPSREGPPTVLEFACRGLPEDIDGLRTVFSTGNLSICRINHQGNPACPCTSLGDHGIPISRFMAHDGKLTIVFHTADFEELRSTMDMLQDQFPNLDIRRMIRSPTDYQDDEYVMIDTGGLTERQLQMLEIAHKRGYFKRPRQTNATEIAREHDIDPSTFREHVNIGLSKLLESILMED